MKHYLSAFLAISLLSSCANLEKNPVVQTEIKTEHTFTSVGYAPIEPQSGDSEDIKILNAIKASKIEAYKEMAEQIYGVLLSADNSVKGSYLIDDKIKSRVKGLVKGATVLRSYHEGGLYITELELNMETLNLLNNTTFKKQGSAARQIPRSVYY